MEPQDMLSQSEAAKYLGVSVPTLLRLVAEGDIPAYMLGKRRKFYVKDLINAFKPVQP